MFHVYNQSTATNALSNTIDARRFGAGCNPRARPSYTYIRTIRYRHVTRNGTKTKKKGWSLCRAVLSRMSQVRNPLFSSEVKGKTIHAPGTNSTALN